MARRPHATSWLIALAAWGIVLPATAEEKLILLDKYPHPYGRFKVAPDGSKLYFAGPKYLVFDAQGKLIDQVGVPQGSSTRDLIPLPDGWFIACDSYGNGHLALCRPDGTEAKVLVRKEGGEKGLRGDMTGWTSPNGAAVDVGRRRIFVIDTTMAPAGTPDPDWSRIAMFDFDGKYLGDINRYDAQAKDKDDARRTWYDDVAVDPGRQRLYALARRTRELLAFDYEGKLLAKVAAQGNGEGQGGLAVFPDGRVAAGTGGVIQIYNPELKPLRALRLPAEAASTSVLDVECDASGRLYASVRDAGLTFLRWSSDLEKSEAFGPRYQRIEVQFADTTVTAGTRFAIKARVSGRPQPARQDQWQVLARPSDGSALRWQSLPVVYQAGALQVTAPPTFRGPFEVAVRFGPGPIAWANRANDPYLQKTFAFLRPGAVRSVAVVSASGRTAFRAGESIPL